MSSRGYAHFGRSKDPRQKRRRRRFINLEKEGKLRESPLLAPVVFYVFSEEPQLKGAFFAGGKLRLVS